MAQTKHNRHIAFVVVAPVLVASLFSGLALEASASVLHHNSCSLIDNAGHQSTEHSTTKWEDAAPLAEFDGSEIDDDLLVRAHIHSAKVDQNTFDALLHAPRRRPASARSLLSRAPKTSPPKRRSIADCAI